VKGGVHPFQGNKRKEQNKKPIRNEGVVKILGGGGSKKTTPPTRHLVLERRKDGMRAVY